MNENPDPSGVPRSAYLLDMAAIAVAAAIVIGIGWSVVDEGLLARQAVVWLANVVMLAGVWVSLKRHGQSWADIGLSMPDAKGRSWGRTFLLSLAVVVVALLGFAVGSLVGGAIFGPPPPGGPAGYDYLQGNLPMLLLAIAGVLVVSSFGEEVIYRGYLMTRVAAIGGAGKRGWRIAVVVSAVVFGLIHFGWGAFGVVQTTFMGLALALAYLYTGRALWTLVLAHAYMDIILLVQLYASGA